MIPDQTIRFLHALYGGQHFGFLPTRGVARCFGRHGQLLLHDLCTHMEIDPADYGGLYQK